MEVIWYKCKGDIWCELDKIDADHKNLDDVVGVYIIWSIYDNKLTTLRTGEGNIREQIKLNKNDLSILAFYHLGVFITWTIADDNLRTGILAYLEEELKPKITKEKIEAEKIEVNLPWTIEKETL